MDKFIGIIKEVLSYGIEGYFMLLILLLAFVCFFNCIIKDKIKYLVFGFIFLFTFILYLDEKGHGQYHEISNVAIIDTLAHTNLETNTESVDNSISDILSEKIQKYDNGDVYIGQLFDNKREGYGIYYYSSGHRYEGWWHNGHKEGTGIYYFDEVSRSECTWKNGKEHGDQLLICHGYMSENTYFNGLLNGTCIRYDDSGDRVVTVYKMDSLLYSRNIPFPDNASGYFVYNKQNKRVEFLAVNDEDFELVNDAYKSIPYDETANNWVSSLNKNSVNTTYAVEEFSEHLIKYDNGNFYKGQLLNGKPEGYGIYYDSIKDERYEGWWHNGRKEGKGNLYEKDESIYYGLWHNGKRHGYGATIGRKLLKEDKYDNGVLAENTLFYDNGNREITLYQNGEESCVITSHLPEDAKGYFEYNEITRRIEYVTDDEDEYKQVNDDCPTNLYKENNLTDIVVNPIYSTTDESAGNSDEEDSDLSEESNCISETDNLLQTNSFANHWQGILFGFISLFVIFKIYLNIKKNNARKANIRLLEKSGKEIVVINNKSFNLSFHFLNAKAKIIYNTESRDNTVIIHRNYQNYKFIDVLSPFPFRFFSEYYKKNKDSKYWKKNKYSKLKEFMDCRIWESGNYIYSIKEINKCYYLRTRVKICYYDYYNSPDNEKYNKKIYDVIETSTLIQNTLVDFLKDNRSFWEKTKSFVRNHPKLVGFTFRIGLVCVTYGLSELLMDVMDSQNENVDISSWFTADGTDPTDASIDLMTLEENSYDDSLSQDDENSENSISFHGKRPPNADCDGYIYQGGKKYDGLELYRKDNHWWVYDNNVWKMVADSKIK